MSVYFRGDPEPVKWIRELPDGNLEVWMTSDDANEAPLTTTRASLVADNGANEIDAMIARCNGLSA